MFFSGKNGSITLIVQCQRASLFLDNYPVLLRRLREANLIKIMLSNGELVLAQNRK